MSIRASIRSNRVSRAILGVLVAAAVLVYLVVLARYVVLRARYGSAVEFPNGDRFRAELGRNLRSHFEAPPHGFDLVSFDLLRHRARKTGFGPAGYLVWVEVNGPDERFWIVRVQRDLRKFTVLNAWSCSEWKCATVFQHFESCEEIVRLQAAHRCG